MKTKIVPSSSNHTKTFKTQHTFASNQQDQCYIEQQQNFDNQNNDFTTKPFKKSPQQVNYDQQFQKIYHQLLPHSYFGKISKHQKIRINKWLTKLSNITTNDLWKRNRNNYIKLIRLMFDCEIIIAPFQMMPPDRDLHKLTNHQINVIINQIEKILNQRENCNNNGTTVRNISTPTNRNNNNKMSKILWTQQSAYIDHQNKSVDKYKQQSSFSQYNGSTKSPYKNSKTHESISVNIANSRINNKFSSLSNHSINIPPKHPSSSKNKSLQKSNFNVRTSNQVHTKQQDKQFCFIKQPQQQLIKKQNPLLSNTSRNQYFIKKQRYNNTYAPVQQTRNGNHNNDEQYLMMVEMKNSGMDKTTECSKIKCGDGDGNSNRAMKENRNCLNQNYQTKSQHALQILKQGFKLLQTIPKSQLNCNKQNSLQQFTHIYRMLNQYDFLKENLQRENGFLKEIVKDDSFETNCYRSNGKEVNQNSGQNQNKFVNNSRKNSQKKKMKLTLLSQSTSNRI